VKRQLRHISVEKLAKADDDEEQRKKTAQTQASSIVDDLDLAALGGLSGFADPLGDTAADRAGDVLYSLDVADEDAFNGVNTRAAQWASEHAGELVSQIDESTRNMLRQRIAEGLATGAMRDDIIDSLSDIFDDDRATLIAGTEIAMASGHGAQSGREAY
jgi:hypothetical protein